MNAMEVFTHRLQNHAQRLSAPALALVVLAHGGVLYALQTMGAFTLPLPPAALMVDLVQDTITAPKAPVVTPPEPEKALARPTPVAQNRPQPVAAAPVLAAERAQAAPEFEVAKAQKAPAPVATTAPAMPSATATTASSATAATTPTASTTSAAAPAPQATAPLFDADYLDNPAPAYPYLSKRAGEEGRVLLHVFVEASGVAGKLEVRTSSGFERLDRAAMAAVKRWKFVSAKQGTEAVAAWVLVPIVFSLKG
jgi:protein TonB